MNFEEIKNIQEVDQITDEHINTMRDMLYSGKRAEVYLYYASLIGSKDSTAVEQLMQQAQITTYSGAMGGAALMGNFNAKKNAPNEYILDLDIFTVNIIEGMIAHVELNLNDNGTGLLTANEIQDADYNVWDSKEMGHLFPGNYQLSFDFLDGEIIPNTNIILDMNNLVNASAGVPLGKRQDEFLDSKYNSISFDGYNYKINKESNIIEGVFPEKGKISILNDNIFNGKPSYYNALIREELQKYMGANGKEGASIYDLYDKLNNGEITQKQLNNVFLEFFQKAQESYETYEDQIESLDVGEYALVQNEVTGYHLYTKEKEDGYAIEVEFLQYDSELDSALIVIKTDPNIEDLVNSQESIPENKSTYVYGDEGNDILKGDSKDNVIYGYEGNDKIYGKDGNDNLSGGGDNDELYGGDGDDFLKGRNGDDQLFGDEGNDSLHGGNGDDEINGGDGNDKLYGGDGSDKLFADDGDDHLNGEDGDDLLDGGEGNDLLDGGEGDDKIYGNEDDDKIYGRNGNDLLDGGEGDDKIYGNEDDDKIYGKNGNDYLSADDGNDVIYAGNGNDSLHGGNGDDELNGEDGSDILYGDLGDDQLYGNEGDDQLYGDEGNDLIKGGNDDDQLYGLDGNDSLHGGTGSDELNGGEGDDEIYGEDGNDLIIYNQGNDILSGGPGDDLYKINNFHSNQSKNYQVIILDYEIYNPNEKIALFPIPEDILFFEDLQRKFSYNPTKNETTINLTNHFKIILKNVNAELLTANDFVGMVSYNDMIESVLGKNYKNVQISGQYIEGDKLILNNYEVDSNGSIKDTNLTISGMVMGDQIAYNISGQADQKTIDSIIESISFQNINTEYSSKEINIHQSDQSLNLTNSSITVEVINLDNSTNIPIMIVPNMPAPPTINIPDPSEIFANSSNINEDLAGSFYDLEDFSG